MSARRERIHALLERNNRVLILQGTHSLKLIEIDENMEIPCYVRDVVTVLEKEREP